MTDSNLLFMANCMKNIVKDGGCFKLQVPYYLSKDGVLKETMENINNPSLDCAHRPECDLCTHYDGMTCEVLNELLGIAENCIVYSSRTVNKCDAYDEMHELNIIISEQDMVNFIKRSKNFFGSNEDYEDYFGFSRNWDEATGEILETVDEYYARGGKFLKIPTQYPVVIWFDTTTYKPLDWITIAQRSDYY